MRRGEAREARTLASVRTRFEALAIGFVAVNIEAGRLFAAITRPVVRAIARASVLAAASVATARIIYASLT